jgi:prevent-host-death family protein
MRTVTARIANHEFSSLLSDVEQGQEVLITKHGKPVAVLSPYKPPEMTEERRRAIEEAIQIMEEPLPWEDEDDPDWRPPSRDEIYER